ncbi:flagellar basal body-associated FliL family protein [Undibacterium sp.]|jgi:flagellar basal body-associated protein FliL|uniref:flagellar basal body-associated FliL family protein n=1 Tax=Undibacterium sp. TaxID=1914977 RepID=UPI002BC5DCD7|nr:flagellar basal body-associated FliL family protein [Undibacterium sp.]HTD03052.1 flagellar basal body-associated FliL family protein [Undibacterium sp.]
MPKQTTAAPLSSKLQFEGVGLDGKDFAESAADSFDDWDSLPSPPASPSAALPAQDAEKAETSRRRPRRQFVASPPVEDTQDAFRRNQVGKPSKSNFRRKDNFAQYAASLALLGTLLFASGIYSYVRRAPANEAALSYSALPAAVINVDGQVARLQVTIQVDAEDQEWLEKNKKVIQEIFQIVVSKANPLDLRSPQGFQSMQEELKDEINSQMKVDKVQAVLLTELMMQSRG